MLEKRIHIYRDKEKTNRTTVSIEKYLYELLAIYLGHMPDSSDARPAVTKWLQDQMFDEIWYDKRRQRISQFLRMKIINVILDKDLARKHSDWMFPEYKNAKDG